MVKTRRSFLKTTTVSSAGLIIGGIVVILFGIIKTREDTKIKSPETKRKWTEGLIFQGDFFFKRGEYIDAAKAFEKAVNFILKNGLDQNLRDTAIKQSMLSWIAAYKIDSAFSHVDKISDPSRKELLNSLYQRIIEMIKSLIDDKKMKAAKTQLKVAASHYKKAGLIEESDLFNQKLGDLS
ncbi:MAG: hypothetical protein ACFFG0_06375 [Candidatus Thorarchaeota archaeon]